MENFYKKYQNYHQYLQEYFDDVLYDKLDYTYHNIYLPFIKKYLPNIIKRELNEFKGDNYDLIMNQELSKPFIFEPEREIITYIVEDDTFVISMWHYNEALKMIKNFFNMYNLNPKEIKIKELIDAYYMELQRIDYELKEDNKYINYYDKFMMQANYNESLFADSMAIYEELFINTFIPNIINNFIANISNETNWEHASINFVLKSGKDNLIKDAEIIIDERYFDIVLDYIKSFINDYKLGNIEEDNNIIVHISSIKKLVDAYYMELQSKEYQEVR